MSRAEKNTWQLLKKDFLSANEGLKVSSLKIFKELLQLLYLSGEVTSF